VPKINLYDDQAEFVHKLRQAVAAGHKSILGVASPAFGKTVVAGYITESAVARDPGASVWFLVHRKNLLRQTSQSFWKSHIQHGLITSGKRPSKQPVQVGTIGTAYSRLDKLKPPRVLFVDEAHLAKGNMFETVIRWALEAGALVIGLTGTPVRLDGKALGDIFDCMIEARSTQWLIEQGRLSEYEIYTTPIKPDLTQVKKGGGDYNRSQLAEAMDKAHLVGDAVSHWKKYAPGMRTVCYCVNVKHSKHTAEAFTANGVPAVHVDADTTEAELKEACEGLATGRYKVLCNCELVIEGFDLSAQVGKDITLECCILLRPTQSEARYLQQIFRALRRKPNAAIILDHAGCVLTHGLPDDRREWSLDGKKKGKRNTKDEDPELHIQQCKSCYHVFKAGPDKCPSCGEPCARKTPAMIQVIEGELEKVNIENERKRQKRAQGQARSIEDLVQVGVERGLNRPAQWAAITYCGRMKKKPTAVEFKTASDWLDKIKALSIIEQSVKG